jgi:hypothetical protein
MPRQRDLPCADCGAMMWSGKGSLPEGRARCHPCRRARPVKPRAKQRLQRPSRPCSICDQAYTPRSISQRYCSNSCAERGRGGRRRTAGDEVLGYEWRKMRRVVVDEETHCGFCNEPVDKSLTVPHPGAPAVDHIVPRTQGGTMDRSNLRLAHARCNSAGKAKAIPDGLVPTRDCEVCARRFMGRTSQRTCSRACGAELRRRSRPPRQSLTWLVKECSQCAVTFETHFGHQVTCSITCRQSRGRLQSCISQAARLGRPVRVVGKEIRPCRQCGAPILHTGRRGRPPVRCEACR